MGLPRLLSRCPAHSRRGAAYSPTPPRGPRARLLARPAFSEPPPLAWLLETLQSLLKLRNLDPPVVAAVAPQLAAHLRAAVPTCAAAAAAADSGVPRGVCPGPLPLSPAAVAHLWWTLATAYGGAGAARARALSSFAGAQPGGAQPPRALLQALSALTVPAAEVMPLAAVARVWAALCFLDLLSRPAHAPLAAAVSARAAAALRAGPAAPGLGAAAVRIAQSAATTWRHDPDLMEAACAAARGGGRDMRPSTLCSLLNHLSKIGHRDPALLAAAAPALAAAAHTFDWEHLVKAARAYAYFDTHHPRLFQALAAEVAAGMRLLAAAPGASANDLGPRQRRLAAGGPGDCHVPPPPLQPPRAAATEARGFGTEPEGREEPLAEGAGLEEDGELDSGDEATVAGDGGTDPLRLFSLLQVHLAGWGVGAGTCTRLDCLLTEPLPTHSSLPPPQALRPRSTAPARRQAHYWLEAIGEQGLLPSDALPIAWAACESRGRKVSTTEANVARALAAAGATITTAYHVPGTPIAADVAVWELGPRLTAALPPVARAAALARVAEAGKGSGGGHGEGRRPLLLLEVDGPFHFSLNNRCAWQPSEAGTRALSS
jgi:hypothetical protein